MDQETLATIITLAIGAGLSLLAIKALRARKQSKEQRQKEYREFQALKARYGEQEEGMDSKTLVAFYDRVRDRYQFLKKHNDGEEVLQFQEELEKKMLSAMNWS